MGWKREKNQLVKKEKRRSSFLKKRTKKLLLALAVEGAQFGRSKAGDNQKFFGSFFQKRTFLLWGRWWRGAQGRIPPYGSYGG